MTYSDRARRYAKQVVAGKIPAAKWTRLSCQRQIDDLKRWSGKAAPYRFDRAAADGVCSFIECLPHIKGEWANRGELIRLEDWQCFILTNIFGWKRADGLRRYRTAYIEVPRKNAKSTLAAGIALFMLCADGEAGAEVYSAATTRKQARIVFETAQRMAERESQLGAAYGIEINAHCLSIARTGSRFEPLFSEGKTLDGLNVHCAVIDELHAHRTRKVFEVLETARGSRAQPLLFLITTAGSDQSGICYEQRSYVTKLVDGVVTDETYFGIIYTIDDGDDWTKEAVYRKANPNLGVSVYVDDIKSLSTKAQAIPAAVNGVLTKRFDVWCNADVGLFDAAAWRRCADPQLTIDDYRGKRCFVAVDLASRDDIAAAVFWFPGEERHAVFGRYYLPRETVEKAANSQYYGWWRGGKIVATEGATIDFDQILEDLRADSNLYDIEIVGVDPWQGTHFMQRLQAEGAKVVEVRQTVANFSEPLKDIIGLHKEGKLAHAADPVLDWMISNTVGHYDAKENVYPRKERPENKIDGVVAMIMARSLAMRFGTTQESVYATRGLIEV